MSRRAVLFLVAATGIVLIGYGCLGQRSYEFNAFTADRQSRLRAAYQAATTAGPLDMAALIRNVQDSPADTPHRIVWHSRPVPRSFDNADLIVLVESYPDASPPAFNCLRANGQVERTSDVEGALRRDNEQRRRLGLPDIEPPTPDG